MGYTKQASKFLKEHGYEKVESIEIIRTPLSSKIDTLLNLITLGKFTEAKSKAEYDKLFHLAIIVETKQGHYMMEKNENIRLGAVKNITSQTERKYAIPKNTAVHQLLDRAQHLQGDHDYFTYSAFQNNCQSFVLSVLKGSHIASKELQDFVKQNPAKILEHLPAYTNKLANILTDLASIFGHHIEKQDTPQPTGIHLQPNYKVLSVHLSKEHFTEEEAKLWVAQNKFKVTTPQDYPQHYVFRQMPLDLIKAGHYTPKRIKIDNGFLVVAYN